MSVLWESLELKTIYDIDELQWWLNASSVIYCWRLKKKKKPNMYIYPQQSRSFFCCVEDFCGHFLPHTWMCSSLQCCWWWRWKRLFRRAAWRRLSPPGHNSSAGCSLSADCQSLTDRGSSPVAPGWPSPQLRSLELIQQLKRQKKTVWLPNLVWTRVDVLSHFRRPGSTRNSGSFRHCQKSRRGISSCLKWSCKRSGWLVEISSLVYLGCKVKRPQLPDDVILYVITLSFHGFVTTGLWRTDPPLFYSLLELTISISSLGHTEWPHYELCNLRTLQPFSTG